MPKDKGQETTCQDVTCPACSKSVDGQAGSEAWGSYQQRSKPEVGKV